MKISYTITAIILCLAGAFGWQDHRKLEQVTALHQALSEEAGALGVSLDHSSAIAGFQTTKRVREDKEAEARLAAKDLIASALEMKDLEKRREQRDDGLQERSWEVLERILSLDTAQMKILIMELRDSTELDEKTRTGIISFAIMTLANDHPEAALALFTESKGLLGGSTIPQVILSSSLANWATRDPQGALEWVRINGKTHPDLVTDQVKVDLLKGAAANGLAFSFNLLKELNFKNPNDAVGKLASGVKNEAERTEFLTQFRNYSKSSSSIQSLSPLIELGQGIAKDGFAEGSKWIETNSLSPAELDALGSSIARSAKGAEKGEWIEWMGQNLSPQKRDDAVTETMREWTRTDYRAAGEWLAKAPPGPVRNSAVQSYVKTVARYDPATATQWALTLPAGKQQENALNAIYSEMPNQSPEEKVAKEAFKDLHRIE